MSMLSTFTLFGVISFVRKMYIKVSGANKEIVFMSSRIFLRLRLKMFVRSTWICIDPIRCSLHSVPRN